MGPAVERSALALALACAAVATMAYVAIVALTVGVEHQQLGTVTPAITYNAPIGFLFVLWLFDAHWQRPHSGAALVLMGVVVAAALVRALWLVPGYSGHALFTSFAIVTLRTRWFLPIAIGVMAQILYLKLAWGDFTWAGGVVLGALAGVVVRRQRIMRDAVRAQLAALTKRDAA